MKESRKMMVKLLGCLAYSDGRFDVLNVRFFDKDLFSPLAQCLDLALLNVLALFELFNPLIKIVLASLLRHSSIIFLFFQ